MTGQQNADYALTESQQRTVDQVRVLFPYLHFHERCEWVARLKPWFGDDFVACTAALQNDGSGADR